MTLDNGRPSEVLWRAFRRLGLTKIIWKLLGFVDVGISRSFPDIGPQEATSLARENPIGWLCNTAERPRACFTERGGDQRKNLNDLPAYQTQTQTQTSHPDRQMKSRARGRPLPVLVLV